MTDGEFLTWLAADSSVRIVLVEAVASVSGSETTRYMASKPYVTKASDTPANREYAAVLSGGMQISERLGLSGSTAMAFGDIEIKNLDGARDSWLSDVWANREVSVYVGDPRWPRSDFRLVFAGLIEDIGSRARDVLNLKVRDKLQRLNTAVTDAVLGGSTANAERLLPVCLGEVHNIEPLLTNPATLEFKVHGGAIERIIEVRDSGVPVTVTGTLGSGKFTLSASPAGQITASIQGDKPSTYSNTIATLVRRLATGYGTSPLDDATEVDDDSFDDFDAAHTQPVGLYLSERTNVLTACKDLAASVGAQVVMSALGKLQLIQVALPAVGTPTTVTAANMAERSIEVSDRPPVRAGVKLNYCLNYTVQTNLQTGIPAEHKDLYGQQWLTASDSDSAVATAYRTTEAPEAETSLLLVTADAQTEATRRLTLWSTQRTVYRFTGLPELMLLALGAPLTIQHTRFGMGSGITGQIVGVTRDWLAGRITVEVLT